MISLNHLSGSGITTIGIEDLKFNPNQSHSQDFNDLIVNINMPSIGIF